MIETRRRFSSEPAFGVLRCPDCNHDIVSARGLAEHKKKGGCVVVPGARARLALLVAAAIAGRTI